MSTKTLFLFDKLYKYMMDISIKEPDILKDLRERTSKMDESDMQICPEQGQFMGLIVRMLNVKKAIEVGVFTGYSSICTALNMADGGKLIACDKNAGWTSIAQKYWKRAGVDNKIDLVSAPAADTLNKLIKEGQAGSFDFAFIDADKGNYDLYYELTLKLLRIGGIMMMDNMFWDGKVVDEAIDDDDALTIRNMNEKIGNDGRIISCLLPIGDGLTIILKK